MIELILKAIRLFHSSIIITCWPYNGKNMMKKIWKKCFFYIFLTVKTKMHCKTRCFNAKNPLFRIFKDWWISNYSLITFISHGMCKNKKAMHTEHIQKQNISTEASQTLKKANPCNSAHNPFNFSQNPCNWHSKNSIFFILIITSFLFICSIPF